MPHSSSRMTLCFPSRKQRHIRRHDPVIAAHQITPLCESMSSRCGQDDDQFFSLQKGHRTWTSEDAAGHFVLNNDKVIFFLIDLDMWDSRSDFTTQVRTS